MSDRQCIVCPVLYPDGEPREWERRWVCSGCRARLHRDLSELQAQAAMLDPEPRAGGGPRVSGTRSAPLPVNEDAFNLAGPGNSHVHDEHGDQIGPLPIRVWLSEWSMWWGSVTPRTLEKACDEDLGIAGFAEELVGQLAAARSANKDTDQRPDYKHGVPCKRCDTKALSQAGGRDDYIACGKCGLLYTPTEYAAWTKLLAEWAKRLEPDTPNVA